MCDLCTTNGPSRRRLLGGGIAMAGLAAAGLLGGLATPTAAFAQAARPNDIPPAEALKRLKDGNARYAANKPRQHDFSAGRAARASAQYPFAAILSCADSRVAPELAFDQGPGELFVCRVAGNFVNDDGLASLEYGVQVLGLPLIMVLGHSNCGAIDATIKVVKDNITLPGHLPGLVNALKPGIEAAIAKQPKDLLATAIEENVRFNVRRLRDASPILSKAVADKKLQVVGGVYEIGTGKVAAVEA